MENILGGLGGLFAGLGSAASSFVNWQSQKETNAQNERLMRESWSREDNAVSRRTRDLKAAGLNPVLAAGSAAQSGGPIRLEAPQVRGNPVADALAGAQAAVSIAQTQAQTSLTKAQADRAESQAKLEAARVPYAGSLALSESLYAERRATLEEQKRMLLGNQLAGAELDNLINTQLKKYAPEFAQLELESKRKGLDALELENQKRKLAAKLMQKDIDWYDANATAGNVGRYVGAAAQLGRMIPY